MTAGKSWRAVAYVVLRDSTPQEWFLFPGFAGDLFAGNCLEVQYCCSDRKGNTIQYRRVIDPSNPKSWSTPSWVIVTSFIGFYCLLAEWFEVKAIVFKSLALLAAFLPEGYSLICSM